MIGIIKFALQTLWGQFRHLGKPLPKNGLCSHLKKVEQFTYLGGTPYEYCRVDNEEFGYDFIDDKWFEFSEE